MKTLFAAAVLTGMLALSACTAAGPQEQPAPASSPAAAAQEKAHFTGDYSKTTAEDSAEILELSRQWYSAEKQEALVRKMEAAGLGKHIPADLAPVWYMQAATSCQAKFDGHPVAAEGVHAEIDKLVLETYCPELI